MHQIAHKEIKGETDKNTIIVGDLKTPLTALYRSAKQKINTQISVLCGTLDQMDIIDLYRTFHLKTSDYTLFSSAYETFSRIDHMLGHKTCLNKFKKIDIIRSIFSDHSDLKLDINCKKEVKNPTNMWKLNKILLRNDWVKEEIKDEIKKHIETAWLMWLSGLSAGL